MKRKWFALPILALILSLASGCIIVTDDPGDASLTVANESDFVITELYLTPAGVSTFGRDLLGPSGFLFPGDSIVLDVSCDFYDAQVVDETGFGCILLDLDLCFNDALWVIDNRELATCGF